MLMQWLFIAMTERTNSELTAQSKTLYLNLNRLRRALIPNSVTLKCWKSWTEQKKNTNHFDLETFRTVANHSNDMATLCTANKLKLMTLYEQTMCVLFDGVPFNFAPHSLIHILDTIFFQMIFTWVFLLRLILQLSKIIVPPDNGWTMFTWLFIPFDMQTLHCWFNYFSNCSSQLSVQLQASHWHA